MGKGFFLGVFFLPVLMIVNRVAAQQPGEVINNFLGNDRQLHLAGIKQPELVKEVYHAVGYGPVWTVAGGMLLIKQFSDRLSEDAYFGLQKENYRYPLIKSLQDRMPLPLSVKDTLTAEVQVMDAFCSFIHDIAFGYPAPSLGYKGPGAITENPALSGLMAYHLKKGDLNSLIVAVEPGLPVYRKIKTVLAGLLDTVQQKGFADIHVAYSKGMLKSKKLAARLRQSGFAGYGTDSLTENQMKQVIAGVQQRYNLPVDSMPGRLTIAALNISLQQRITQLSVSLNYYRWFYHLQKYDRVILVNIAAGLLRVYNNNSLQLQMRVITGKPSTPSPTLFSTVNEVVLYPYWMVPHSIATKELLPAIKRNRSYLEQNNYQVLNKSGKLKDPRTINWSGLSSSYFPYTIRQATGCDNALGVIKFNFYNPFSAYLHDTPDKTLFSKSSRFFSHGCIRLQHADSLAFLLLGANRIALDTLSEKGCLEHQDPRVIMIGNPYHILIWYNTADLGEKGDIVFYPDVYRKGY